MDTIDLLEMSSPFETEDGRRVTGVKGHPELNGGGLET